MSQALPNPIPNYHTSTHPSAEDRAVFVEWLTAITVAELQAARENDAALAEAVKHYVNYALAAGLPFEAIEDILGISEPSIMDLAELSEEDEEAVVDAFEDLCNA